MVQEISYKGLDMLPPDFGHVQGHTFGHQITEQLLGSPDLSIQGRRAQIFSPDMPGQGVDIDRNIAAYDNIGTGKGLSHNRNTSHRAVRKLFSYALC